VRVHSLYSQKSFGDWAVKKMPLGDFPLNDKIVVVTGGATGKKQVHFPLPPARRS
jgi:hypothetical protein